MKKKVPDYHVQMVLDEFYEVIDRSIQLKKLKLENSEEYFEDEKNSSTFAETSTGS